jgi:polyadenylate-binding protein
MQDKNLLYLYDLPKDSITSTKIATKIKEAADYELAEPPQIRRDPNKPFYSAIVKINDPEKFKKVAEKMKYFDIDGKPCRSLPFDRELLGINRSQIVRNNVFVKHLDKNINSADLEKRFAEVGDVKCAKVSINPDYSSRGYGFVCFANPEKAAEAVNKGKQLNLEVLPYNPRDRREVRKAYNNIYVKNFPDTWTEAKLREIFGKYGTIKSLVVMKKQREGQDHESAFAFICYEDPSDKEVGPRCAMNAVQ